MAAAAPAPVPVPVPTPRSSIQPPLLLPLTLVQAQNQMQECDIILCRGKYWISRIFEKLTKAAYSHVGIAAYWGNDLMLLQAEIEGVEAVPLRITVAEYNGKVDWYRLKPEFLAKLDKGRLMKEAKRDLGVEYGLLDLWRDLIEHRLLHYKLPPDDPNRPTGLFCSEYVARCFRIAGSPLTPHKDINTMPTDISASSYVEYKGTIHL